VKEKGEKTKDKWEIHRSFKGKINAKGTEIKPKRVGE
jgi:hypothetical protein